MLTSLALMVTYAQVVNIEVIDLLEDTSSTLIGLLVGGLMPFVFSALDATGRGSSRQCDGERGETAVPGDTGNYGGHGTSPSMGRLWPSARTERSKR